MSGLTFTTELAEYLSIDVLSRPPVTFYILRNAMRDRQSPRITIIEGTQMTAIPQLNHPNQILRLKQVTACTGLSRSTVYDKLDVKSRRHDPSFPKSIKLTETSVGWVSSEVYAWIEARIALSRKSVWVFLTQFDMNFIDTWYLDKITKL